MIACIPNLFMITGPQSPGVKSQMILACEQHVDWIADCMQYLRDHGFSRIEAEEDAEDAWVQHNNEVADRTLYPLANSWYVGAALSGKRPAGSERFGVGWGHDSDFLSPASFSAGRHPARRVAVPSLHPKLSRCRRAACRAWPRPLLRKRSQLGAQIRTRDRARLARVPSSTERSLASRRNGR